MGTIDWYTQNMTKVINAMYTNCVGSQIAGSHTGDDLICFYTPWTT